ncbi:MAG: glycosyltransferase family 2 protein [Syntrophales bacterium]
MSRSRKTISVVAGCYNEEGNLQPFYDRLMKVFEQLPGYDYEIIVADNCSTDDSQEILRRLAAGDRKFKVILNANNYGQIRSPFHALLQATGDAVVAITSDLQNPPELLPEFVKKWEEGHEVVVAVKRKTTENAVLSMVRNFYYYLLSRFSESDHIVRGFTGFGLYDRKFMDALGLYKNSYPYFRGLVGEIGFRRATVLFDQPPRRQGRSKNNFFTLYDVAMTGFVNHSRLPLRLATMTGFAVAILSLLVATGYFVYKLVFWDSFSVGIAPLVIGLFFFSSVQLFFIGIVGEYIGAIHTQVLKRPLVIEKERINFD